MRRRDALIAMAAPLLVGYQANAAPTASAAQGLFLRLVDVLIPADAMSPAASDLGVHIELEATVREHALLTRLFEFGLGWVDQAGGRPFLELPEQAQVDVLTFAEQADFNQIPGRFFAVLRLLSCEIYFSKPEAIAGYPLNKAPQPDGYLPPWS